MNPGEYILATDPITCNNGRRNSKITVVNTGDRPVQIGSHFHFFEVNRWMVFDRGKAFGMRLNIAAGTAVRFEPGEEKEVELVALGGRQRVIGFSRLAEGSTEGEAAKEAALEKARVLNFKTGAL